MNKGSPADWLSPVRQARFFPAPSRNIGNGPFAGWFRVRACADRASVASIAPRRRRAGQVLLLQVATNVAARSDG